MVQRLHWINSLETQLLSSIIIQLGEAVRSLLVEERSLLSGFFFIFFFSYKVIHFTHPTPFTISGCRGAAKHMGELVKVAKEKSVKLVLLNCEPDKSLGDLKSYAASQGAGDVEHYQVKSKAGYTQYFPFHVVAKGGKFVMVGGYDMTKRTWKPWETIAGLK